MHLAGLTITHFSVALHLLSELVSDLPYFHQVHRLYVSFATT